MSLDLAIAGEIKHLRRAGLRPNEQRVQHILRAGAAAVGPLLALALETDLLHEDEPECYAPIHALRLLGELGSPEIIASLLGAFPLEQYYSDEQLPVMWGDEASQMIGRLGAAAVAPLWAIIDDPSEEIVQRGVALSALVYATVVAPEVRDGVVAGLLERLPHSEDAEFSAHLVAALASLGVASVYKDVMDLYRQGRIDTAILQPAAARQLLLSGGDLPALACVTHTLWERYDHHGPSAAVREA